MSPTKNSALRASPPQDSGPSSLWRRTPHHSNLPLNSVNADRFWKTHKRILFFTSVRKSRFQRRRETGMPASVMFSTQSHKDLSHNQTNSTFSNNRHCLFRKSYNSFSYSLLNCHWAVLSLTNTLMTPAHKFSLLPNSDKKLFSELKSHNAWFHHKKITILMTLCWGCPGARGCAKSFIACRYSKYYKWRKQGFKRLSYQPKVKSNDQALNSEFQVHTTLTVIQCCQPACSRRVMLWAARQGSGAQVYSRVSQIPDGMKRHS